MNTKLEQLKEYAKIIKDTPYALKTYLQTYDNTKKKYVPLELFPDQLQLLKDYDEYNENITRKYRQAGVTTVTAAWISKILQVAKRENPEKVLIIANKRDTAIEMANKIRAFLDQWPDWMNVGFSPEKNSESRFKLNNGCEVKAVATSPDALRGYTPTILVFDEAAYIEAGEGFWAASMASLSCVHEDSYILTDNGLIQLKDIITEKNKIGFSPYNGKLKVINKDLEITEIKNTFKSKKTTCYKIKTEFGYKLTGSFKHPLLLKQNNTDEWTWLENLNVGDEIKLQYNQNLFGKDDEEIIFDFKHSLEREKYILPKKLGDDLDLCYLYGLLISNGNFDVNSIAMKNHHNTDIHQFLIDIGFKMFKKSHYYFPSSYLRRFFCEYIGIRDTKFTKIIPPRILQSSENVIKWVLKGIFEIGSTIEGNKIVFTSRSEELVHQLQILLLNFGIKTKTRHYRTEKTKQYFIPFKMYDIEILDYNKFIDKIGFKYYKAEKSLDETIDSNENYFYDKIIDIESFDDDTYDLEIPNGSSFVSNGIISHNTGGKIILVSCVTKDTMVFTDDGLQEVDEFINEEEEIGKGYNIDAYNILGKNGSRTSNIMFNNGKQKTLQIITDKTELEGTLNHKVWAYNNNKIDWVELKDLKIGDYLNVNFGFEKWGKGEFFEQKFAYFLGAVILCKIEFTEDNYVKITAKRSLKKLLEKYNFDYNQVNYEYTIWSRQLFDIFKAIDYVIPKENENLIPKKILMSNREIVTDFLLGLIHMNGYRVQQSYYFRHKNKKLVHQVRMLLMNMGILPHYKTHNDELHKINFSKSIFYQYYKNKPYVERLSINFNNIIPLGSEIIKEIINENKIRKGDVIGTIRTVYTMAVNNEIMTRHHFVKFLNYVIDKKLVYDKEKIDKIYDNKSRWVKITNIIESENYTYDFSLYKNDNDFWCHSILYNGILGHQTPNGHDPIYYGVYDQSIRGLNNFHITDLRWFKDPRYNNDLRWVKCSDIIHYMLNREVYNDDEVVMYDFDHSKYNEYLADGYKPFSSWFESMAKKFKYDKRLVSQELECNFLGSGDGVISSVVQDNIAKNMIREPIEKYMQNTFWQWKEPILNHRYIIGCLPPNEKVLTETGLQNIIDITVDDKLVNENGDYVKIINKQTYSVIDEDIYEIGVDNTFRTTTFTKEHPILISKPILKRNYKRHIKEYNFNQRYWDFNFNYVKTENITVGDWIKTPNIYKKTKYIDFDKKWEENIVNTRYDFKINSPLHDDEFWWFIGLWLGDGWLQTNNYSKSIHICFNVNEKYYLDKLISLIKRLFDRTPILKVTVNNTIECCFNNVELHSFLENVFGEYSYGKKITEWVKYIDIEKKKNLIKGYFDSDGSWYKNKKQSAITFVSINLSLLESIQDIIFSLGVISCLKLLRDEKNTTTINGRLVKTKKTYSLTLAHYDSLSLIKILDDKNDIKLNKFNTNEFIIKNKRIISSCHFSDDNEWIYFKVKKINKFKYTGDVYNFECDTNTFMCHHITTHNCDVSRGDSEDFSSLSIIDFDEREQVAEYIGKIPPDDLASIAYKWGLIYGNAFIVIDITGGMGVATSRKLQELGYKNMYVDGINTQNKWEYNQKALEKIPGINFNNKRIQIIATFEEQLRKGFQVRSSRLLNELNTFVFINGRPDHMKGSHDDAIMGLAMALYVGDLSFNLLEKNDNINKAMMESWTLNERTYNTNESLYSYGSTFDQVGGIVTDYNLKFNEPTRNQYNDYMWLFAKKKP
jgi:intein/homing endonuclease